MTAPPDAWPSEHFTLAELIRSETADRLGIANEPTPAHFENLKVLAIGLEKARAILGKPMSMTSGYRNPTVNKAVGGVANSDHALGFAGDFKTLGLTARYAAELLAMSNLKFDQLIYEASREIVHLSFAPRMRRQVLTQRLGPGTPVINGIV